MNRASEKRLSEVFPELARRVRQIVSAASAKGITLEVVQGFRSFEYQQALYEQGRTRKGPVVTNARPGQSYHNFGLAVDVCPFKNGVPDWNDAKAFNLIGEEARRVGLEWGGLWKTPDRPHVQLSPIPITRCLALYRDGRLPLVWSAVEIELTKEGK